MTKPSELFEGENSSLRKTYDEAVHICCDGECNHDDCCGKVPENCPNYYKESNRPDLHPAPIQQNRKYTSVCPCKLHDKVYCTECDEFLAPHQEENTIEEAMKRFDNEVDVFDSEDTKSGKAICADVGFMKRFITSEIHLAEQKGYERGQQNLLDEWNHDQKQLLDGFAHPKDCKMCKKHNLLKSK